MISKNQLEYKLDIHEENIVRFSTTLETLSNQITHMQTTIETLSERIINKVAENRKLVRAYNEIVRDRQEVVTATAEKFIKDEFGNSVDH